MESSNKNKKSLCSTCNKQILARKFALHLQTHLPEGERTKFKCSVDLCSKIYYSQGSLNEHVKALHSSTPRIKVKCDLCSKEYVQKSYLQAHVRSIHFGTKYGCSLCSAEFKTKKGRNYHVVATHTGEKVFPCEKCPAKFSSACNLRSHQFVHSAEKPHKCSICSKHFKRKYELAKHIRNVHFQRTRAFECSTCQKIFNTKSSLRQHSKAHSLRGRFSCYFCKHESIQRGNLETHLRIHTQEKPYFCPDKFCKYSSAHSSGLCQHKQRHHPSSQGATTSSKSWLCYFCSKSFSHLGNLVIHLRNHTLEVPYACGLCQKVFKCQSSLKSHISTHTKEKSFSCPHCGKCFSQDGNLKAHVAIHTGEKRFSCEFCNYTSFGKAHLVRHLLRHKNLTNL